MEDEICERWKKEQAFRVQDRLSLERGDEVRREIAGWVHYWVVLLCLRTFGFLGLTGVYVL